MAAALENLVRGDVRSSDGAPQFRSLTGSGEKLLQYDIRGDIKESERAIRTNLETHLKERFHVLLSVVEYEIVDEHLVKPGATTPFIESIKKGRDVIQKIMPIASDFAREDAEVDGFSVIDPFMSDDNTPEGSVALSISPNGGPDSKYKHNFYDILTKKKRFGVGHKPKFYVELARYSSGLTTKDYAIKLGLDPDNPPTAADFLRAPFISKGANVSAEDIHKELHKDHEYMDTEYFENRIWGSLALQLCIDEYVQKRDKASFNRILNVADEIEENERRKDRGEEHEDYQYKILNYSELERFAQQPVKQKAGDCPGESGAGEEESSLWSVADTGVGEVKILECHCGFCGKKVKAVIAGGRIYCESKEDGGCGKSAPYKC